MSDSLNDNTSANINNTVDNTSATADTVRRETKSKTVANDGASQTKKSDTGFLMQGSILAVASLVSRVIGLVYRIPLTNIIGKTGNDYYGTAYEIYNLLLIISSYSIPLAVSKLVAARVASSQPKNAMRVLKGSLGFAAVSGGTAGLIVFFFADFFTGTVLKTPLASIALRVLAPTLFIVAIVGVLRGFFQGLNTMVPSAFSQIMEQIVNAIVSVAAAYGLFSYGAKVGAVLGDKDMYAAAYGAAGGTLGTTAGAATALTVMLIVFFAYHKRFKKKLKRDHDRHKETYGVLIKTLILTIIPVLLSTTLYNIVNILDQGIFKNMAVAQGYSSKQISLWWGAYTGEYRVIQNIPLSIASAISAAAVPSLTMAFHSGKMKSVRTQIHSATRFIMIIAFPCAIGMAVIGGPIMQMLFHDSDQTTANLMLTGAVTVLVFSLSTLSNGLLQGIDQLRLPVIHAAIALVLQAVVLYLSMALFHWNIYAMISANTVYGLVMSVLNARSIRNHSGTKQNIWSTFIIPLIASLVMGLFVWLSYHVFHALVHSNTLSTLLSIVLGAIVYFIIMVLMGGITEKEMRRLPKGEVLIRISRKCHLLR